VWAYTRYRNGTMIIPPPIPARAERIPTTRPVAKAAGTSSAGAIG
jgi:hypothetical protein